VGGVLVRNEPPAVWRVDGSGGGSEVAAAAAVGASSTSLPPPPTTTSSSTVGAAAGGRPQCRAGRMVFAKSGGAIYLKRRGLTVRSMRV